LQIADHLADAMTRRADSPALSAISERLETARALIESRFSDAGERLAGSLEMVSSLIESLDRLGAALNAESAGRTTADLLSTAEGLSALPAAQQARIDRLSRLREAGADLAAHIDAMRQTLRYLRAFALNVKITAGATISASDEFSGFAERMCDQLDLGGTQLDQLAEQLRGLGGRLVEALGFEAALRVRYKQVIPAVPDRLAVDAEAIGGHHARIAEVAASVGVIARDIQAKVARALTALQIGDITRQRIEHVQLGLAVVGRTLAESDLAPEARARAQRRIAHLLAEQMADTAQTFETEAGRVTQSLAGMAQDTAQILAFRGLTEARGSGGLRDLELNLSQARDLVVEVGAAMTNARRISGDTGRAVDALARRVDAIHGVKRDIQQMAINSSLRCNRLGDIGKPLNVIALELSSHAGELEAAAEQTLDSLHALARLAVDMDADENGDTLDGARLNGVRDRLKRAADVVDRDLDALNARGTETARSLELATHQLGLKQDLGDALHTAAVVLAEEAGPVVEDLNDIAGVLGAVLDEIARSYTMARERTIHAAHALPGAETTEIEAAPTAADELDDILF